MAEPERHQPLPPLTRLPAFLWRRLPPPARWSLVAAGVVLAVAAAILAPRIADTRRENVARERREDVATREKRVRDLRELQRPRRGSSANLDDPATSAATRRRRRGLALMDLERALAADARRRGGAPRIRRVDCGPLPGVAAPDRDLSRRRGRMSCTAVTSDIRRDRSAVGVIGFPYLAVVDFRSGELTWCRVVGQAGEGGFTQQRLVKIPAACTG